MKKESLKFNLLTILFTLLFINSYGQQYGNSLLQLPNTYLPNPYWEGLKLLAESEPLNQFEDLEMQLQRNINKLEELIYNTYEQQRALGGTNQSFESWKEGLNDNSYVPTPGEYLIPYGYYDQPNYQSPNYVPSHKNSRPGQYKRKCGSNACEI